MKYFMNFLEQRFEQSLKESPEGYDDENTVPLHKYVEKLPYEELFSHTGKHTDAEVAKRLHELATNPGQPSRITEKAYKILATKYPHIDNYAEDARKQVRKEPNEYSARYVSHVLASTKDNADVAKTLKNMSPSHFFFRSPLAFTDSGIEGRLYDKKSYEDIKNSNIKHKDTILAHTEFWNRHQEK